MTRNAFRDYLSSAYGKYVGLASKENPSHGGIANMALNIEVMTARFFDVSSALYGSMSVSNSDSINPVAMAKDLNDNFNRLQESGMSDKIKRDLRMVHTKWRFIEGSVTQYGDEAAYLLVYYNKKQIHKLLSRSQVALAGA